MSIVDPTRASSRVTAVVANYFSSLIRDTSTSAFSFQLSIKSASDSPQTIGVSGAIAGSEIQTSG
ncbi:hypothetical protein [Paraburkholderia sp. J94]|uniref:hypothetical protein n=1 Tax=Paraburkholderia sp. J94 TaxID=2805441 RepID=UPI002AAF9A55|nr:hypothetical protein [Paraburkholderia sp. J94]